MSHVWSSGHPARLGGFSCLPGDSSVAVSRPVTEFRFGGCRFAARSYVISLPLVTPPFDVSTATHCHKGKFHQIARVRPHQGKFWRNLAETPLSLCFWLRQAFLQEALLHVFTLLFCFQFRFLCVPTKGPACRWVPLWGKAGVASALVGWL